MKKRTIKSLVKPAAIVTPALALAFSATSCQNYGGYLIDCTTNPELAGFDAQKLNNLDTYINGKIHEEIKEQDVVVCHGFPSMQVMVSKNGKIAFNKAYGQALRYSQGDAAMTGLGDELPVNQQIPATTNTLYDLASNTKM
jgi:CubicO group peptidase (beta-lactamase class C family)